MFRLIGAACFAVAAAAQAQTVGIVTTPAGSFSNSAGQAMAKVLVEKAKLRTVVQAQGSTGFEEVETGAADFIHKGDDFGAIVRRIKFWVSLSAGTSGTRLEPHVAVISTGTGEAADVLRAAGYFVTNHAPGEVPSGESDAIVIDAPRLEAQNAWSALKNAAVNNPVIVVTAIPVLFAPAVTVAPRAIREDLVSVVDRTLARLRVA